jgi:hypothetical protein
MSPEYGNDRKTLVLCTGRLIRCKEVTGLSELVCERRYESHYDGERFQILNSIFTGAAHSIYAWDAFSCFTIMYAYEQCIISSMPSLPRLLHMSCPRNQSTLSNRFRPLCVLPGSLVDGRGTHRSYH